MVFFLKMMKY